MSTPPSPPPPPPPSISSSLSPIDLTPLPIYVFLIYMFSFLGVLVVLYVSIRQCAIRYRQWESDRNRAEMIERIGDEEADGDDDDDDDDDDGSSHEASEHDVELVKTDDL